MPRIPFVVTDRMSDAEMALWMRGGRYAVTQPTVEVLWSFGNVVGYSRCHSCRMWVPDNNYCEAFCGECISND
jgi:hypothetical protein